MPKTHAFSFFQQRRSDIERDDVAALISQLIEADRKGQERVSEDEAAAASLLAEVRDEIADMQEKAEANLAARLGIDEEGMKAEDTFSYTKVEERYERARLSLQQQYEENRDEWLNRLVCRILEV